VRARGEARRQRADTASHRLQVTDPLHALRPEHLSNERAQPPQALGRLDGRDALDRPLDDRIGSVVPVQDDRLQAVDRGQHVEQVVLHRPVRAQPLRGQRHQTLQSGDLRSDPGSDLPTRSAAGGGACGPSHGLTCSETSDQTCSQALECSRKLQPEPQPEPEPGLWLLVELLRCWPVPVPGRDPPRSHLKSDEHCRTNSV